MPLEWMENYAPLPLQPPRSYGPYPNAPAPQRFSNIPDLKSLLDQCKEPYSALAVPPASILNDARAQFHGPATSEPMPPPPPLPEPEDSQKWENGYKFLEREQKDTRKFMQLVEYQVRSFIFRLCSSLTETILGAPSLLFRPRFPKAVLRC